MTIKYAIPEILSGQLNYYITRWRQEVTEFGDQIHWWQDAVEEASIQQKVGAQASSWADLENEKDNADGHKSGGQYIAVLFGLQLPLTVKPWVTLFEPFNKGRGIFF